MRVLIACEQFGTVREAFRARGHEAWSCDLEPDVLDSRYHLRGDALTLLDPDRWDLMIAHPPCTDLAVSGARYFAAKRADGRQQRALAFVQRLMEAPIPRICVENPVGIISTQLRRPDQIIQPWQFGHPEAKKTCLWLTDLPRLRPARILDLPACGYWENQTPSGQNKLGPSPERALRRAKTYQGIAEAMAEQWGTL